MSPRGVAFHLVTEDLLPVALAARHARDVTVQACLRWNLEHLSEASALIVGELVSNVVDHAHTFMTLKVSVCGEFLQLSVSDGCPQPPILHGMRTARDTRGLGLRLIASNSDAWGYTRRDGEKAVWAWLALDPAG